MGDADIGIGKLRTSDSLEHDSWDSEDAWNSDRLRSSLLAIARSLADREISEDAVQEVLLAGWCKRHVIRSPVRWAARALRLQIAFTRRGQRRRSDREQAVAIPEVQDSPDELLARELLEAVREEVDALSDPYRTTMVHRYLQGLSTQQVAELQGVEDVTVRVRLSRALGQLRDRLERRGVRRGDLTVLLLFFVGETATAESSSVSRHYSRSQSWGWLAILAVVSTVLWLLIPPKDFTGEDASSRLSDHRVASRDGSTGETSKNDTADLRRVGLAGSVSPGPTVGVASGWIGLDVGSRQGDPVESMRVEFFLPSMAAQHTGNGRKDLAFRMSNPSAIWSQEVRGSRLDVPEELWRTHGVRIRVPGHFEFWDPPRVRPVPATVDLGPPIATELRFQGLGSDRKAQIVFEGRSGHRREVDHGTGEPLALELYEPTVVRARVKGYCEIVQWVESPETTLVFRVGEEMEARVVDDRGLPVRHCRVTWEADSTFGRSLDQDLGVTDEAGSIRFGPVPDGESPRLLCAHQSFLTRRFSLMANGDLIQLERGWYIDGRTDQRGSVVAYSEPNPSAFDLVVVEVLETGQFRLGPLPWKPHRLRWEPVGRFSAVESEIAPPIGGSVVPVHLSAPASPLLKGRVRTEDGESVSGVRLVVGSVLGDEVRGETVTSDSSGRIVLSRVSTQISSLRTARTRDLRWRHPSPTPDSLLLEILPPHELLEVNGEAVPSVAHYGSRNTVWIRPDCQFLDVVIRSAVPRPTVRFEAVGRSGETIRARMNLLMINEDGWVVKSFAASDGNLRNPLSREVCDRTTFVALPQSPTYAWSFLDSNQFMFQKPQVFTLKIQPAHGSRGPDQVYVSQARRSSGAAYLGTLDAMDEMKIGVLGSGDYTLWTPRRQLGRKYSGLPTSQLCEVGELRVHESVETVTIRSLPIPVHETSEQ